MMLSVIQYIIEALNIGILETIQDYNRHYQLSHLRYSIIYGGKFASTNDNTTEVDHQFFKPCWCLGVTNNLNAMPHSGLQCINYIDSKIMLHSA